MQKKVLVLFSYDVYPSGNRLYEGHVELLNKFNNYKNNILYFNSSLDDLIFTYDGEILSVTDPFSGLEVKEFDLIFFNKWVFMAQHAYALAIYLKKNNTNFISSEVLHQNPISKIGEFVNLSLDGLPYIKTVVMSSKNAINLYHTLPFKSPYIVKALVSSKGDHNYLVNTKEELISIFNTRPDIQFMIQEYIENLKDYRVTIINGEIAYIIERSGNKEETHLNNTSKGAVARFVDVVDFPDKLKDLSIKAAKSLGRLDFCGVDILEAKDGNYYILEVNKTPEIQTGFQLEIKTQILTDKIAKMLNVDVG